MGLLIRRGLLLVGLCLAAGALAHDTSGGGDVASADRNLAPGEVQLLLGFDTSRHFGRSDDDPRFVEAVHQLALRPLFVFSPLERWSFSVQAPLLRKTQTHATPGYPPLTTTLLGLGDVELGARYALLDVELSGWRHRTAALAGASFPTGNNEAQEAGLRIDEHGQLGIGAVAPALGATHSIVLGEWSGGLAITGRAPLQNRYAYRYGASLVSRLRVGRTFAERLTANLGLLLRYAGRDVHTGLIQNNTGGLLLSATATLSWNVTHDLALVGSAQLPVFERLFGEQRAEPVFGVALMYRVGE